MSTAVFLDDDIIFEVLSWLPPKEIARLRCVCKRWLFLTSEPGFIKCHSTRNPHPRIFGFFLRGYHHNAKFFPLNANSPPGLPDPLPSFIPVLDNRAPISIEASSNGLIICSSHVFLRAIREAMYYICNPTTREFVRLHVPQEVDRCFCLAFSPSNAPNYKIVSMGSQIHVYSSETCAWKLSINEKSLQELELGCISRCYRSVYWNGALIRMARRCIFSFDVEKECVKKLPMPSPDLRLQEVVYMGESGGKVQMIWRPQREKFAVFYISEMGSEGSWSPLPYRADIKPVIDLYLNKVHKRPIYVSRPRWIKTNSSYFPWVLPIHFLRGGEEGGEDGVLLLSIPGRIVSYSLADKLITEVCDSPSPRGAYDILYDWHSFCSFGHALFSP